MVQNKNRRLPKKQHEFVKRQGKRGDLTQFRSQLDALGLKIVEVTGDGNCFFRAIADQLDGNEEEHLKYRRMVVQHIRNYKEQFEPFIEDDVPFDEYCQSMEEDGTWAGNMELQATSVVTKRNICIHRNMSPRWYIRNFQDDEASMIHLSYHDGEHYNSVRLKDDSCEGAAKPIILKADSNLSKMAYNNVVTSNQPKGALKKSVSDSTSVKLVMASTRCTDANKVEQVLQDVYWDVDAAIEFLIAEQQMEENDSITFDVPCEKIKINGDDGNWNYEQFEGAADAKQDQNITNTQSVQNHSIRRSKNIPRNKECTCGSKKKHRPGCGSAEKESSIPIDRKWASNKVRKQVKQAGAKEAARKIESKHGAELPDMGALLI